MAAQTQLGGVSLRVRIHMNDLGQACSKYRHAALSSANLGLALAANRHSALSQSGHYSSHVPCDQVYIGVSFSFICYLIYKIIVTNNSFLSCRICHSQYARQQGGILQWGQSQHTQRLHLLHCYIRINLPHPWRCLGAMGRRLHFYRALVFVWPSRRQSCSRSLEHSCGATVTVLDPARHQVQHALPCFVRALPPAAALRIIASCTEM